MNQDKQKLDLIDWISHLEDAELINYLSSLKDISSQESYSKKALEQAINSGIKDIEEGKTVDHKIVRERYEKYLSS